jgi:peptide-methionine (S)-S-oxide reductase
MTQLTLQTATFASGCFWCTEAVFSRLRGVTKVTSGYIGGHVANPTYEQVSNGTTGHAEALQVVFDPTVISYEQLVEVFFGTHNPTTLNRQGNDVGEQYRSAIFTHSQGQAVVAKAMITKLTADNTFGKPIVTTVEPATTFYPAEEYHRDYYTNNPDQPYCQIVISPKVVKLREKYAALLNEDKL